MSSHCENISANEIYGSNEIFKRMAFLSSVNRKSWTNKHHENGKLFYDYKRMHCKCIAKSQQLKRINIVV